MNTERNESISLTDDLTETWRHFTYDLREAILAVLGPLPYIILLLFVLSYGGEWLGPFDVLFVIALIASFFYPMVVRAINVLRVNLAKRKEVIPEAKDRYVEGPWLDRFGFIVYDAILGEESEFKPITEHKNSHFGHLLGFACVSLLGAMLAFIGTAIGMAWWLNHGDISFAVGVVNEYGPFLRGALPATPLDLILGFIPFISELSFKNQVFVISIMLMTAFVFLNGARYLIEAAGEVHRRLLRAMVRRSPPSPGEALPVGVLLCSYLLILYLL